MTIQADFLERICHPQVLLLLVAETLLNVVAASRAGEAL
jgi:hypothetical protein